MVCRAQIDVIRYEDLYNLSKFSSCQLFSIAEIIATPSPQALQHEIAYQLTIVAIVGH
jgi:hypothetical protein